MNYKNLIRRDVLKVFCHLPLFTFPFFAKSEEILNLEKALSPRYLGDKNAPIQFVEYVSLTCSHCAEFHVKKLPILKEKYIDKGKLRLEMRDFPLDGLALRAAAMARLVAKNKFYAEDIEDLILGCAFPEAEQGMNLARNVVFLAGLPNL